VKAYYNQSLSKVSVLTESSETIIISLNDMKRVDFL